MIKILNTVKKIFPLITIVLWVGCENLDFADPNSPVVESTTIQSLVTGAEAAMRFDLAIYLRVMSVVGREAYYLEPADPRYTGELMEGPMDGGGFLTSRPWNAHYRVIKNCNLLLDNTDLDNGGSGFAKTIKAYNLLMIINVQDENGARLNYDGNINEDVATKAEVFAEIKSLLNEGYSDLGNAGNSFSFSLSSGFAGFDTPSTFAEFNRAIAARVAVYDGRWQDALDALDDSFLDETGDFDEGVYHVYSTGLNDQENGMYENPLATTIKLMGHPTFQTDADPGDARFSSKVLKRSEADTNLAVITYDNLSSDWGITVWSSSVDPVSIIRNEELILLKAEAKIAGGTSGGLTEINIIRDAHDLPAATSGGLVQLLHEKRYSLFLEGHRLIDMRRYNKLGDLPLDRDDDEIVTFPLPETETPG